MSARFVMVRSGTGHQVGVVEKTDARGFLLVRQWRARSRRWNKRAYWHPPAGNLFSAVARIANTDDLRRAGVKAPPSATAA